MDCCTNPGKNVTEKDKGIELKGIGPKFNDFIRTFRVGGDQRQSRSKSATAGLQLEPHACCRMLVAAIVCLQLHAFLHD